MKNNFVAHASIKIYAPASNVWEALVNPKMISQYMFGAKVTTDWKVGSVITWQGKWQGKPFVDKGEILQLDPGNALQYSHFSPISGLEDSPENYHIVTVKLAETETGVDVLLSQDNNPTEQAHKHAEENWQAMLENFKKYVEGYTATS